MILVLLANGFEEIEALTPVDMLRRAGLEVKTVGISGIRAVGSHGIAVECDATPDDVNLSRVKAVIFPGGMPGAENLDKSPFSDKAIDAALKNGGHLAAICAAPLVLGRRGLLRGRRAVCYPGFEGELVGANILDKRVVTDGNITTAVGMGAALEFALEIVQILTDEKRAEELSRATIA